MHSNTLQLSDGRAFAYASFGRQAGKVVVHCNGSGGSRLEWPGDLQMLEELGVRFIGVDRPGHGYSDPKHGRTILDWPRDLVELLDNLKIDEFFIEGWSAGGAYALACAHELQPRVVRGAILSGIAPYDRPSPYDGLDDQIKIWMTNARTNHIQVYQFREMMEKALKAQSAAQIGAMLASGQAEDDKAVAQRPDLQSLMGTNVKEGYRQGSKGPADDDIVINSPWGFRLEEITTPFDVWQGELDHNVPVIQGKYQHSLLPNSKLHLLKNTAHMFPLIRWREILSELTRT